ncbi:MFS transporter [Vallitalea okinawensis]|uniref:MFS transporter n=1 Tax=Vallitalea okinawensis TaxID=2078660 RepID=UPI000CFB8A05|nr:MFS transporter [Vallitalea okinawensis]
MELLKKYFSVYKGLDRQIYFIFISKTVNAMGALIFPFLTLLLNDKIGLSRSETGLFITMSGVVFSVSSLIGGKLTDKIGRKKIIIIFESMAVLLYLSCMFIEPSLIMAYLLLLAGLFYGIAMPAHDAMIADLSTPENRQAAYSLSYLGFNAGFALAQIMAGFLFENYLYMMFLIDAITALMSIIVIGLFVKETINKVDEVDESSKLESKVTGSVFKVLLSRPILIYFAIAVLGYRFVYSQWSFMMPMHAEFNFPDGGAKLYGYLGAFNAIIVVFCTPLLTSLFEKKTNIKRVFYAGILFTIGFGLLGFISIKTAFFASILIFTLGEILEAISTMPFIMNHTPASHRGRISAVLPIIMGMGYTLGPLVIGYVLESLSFADAWKIIGVIGLVATILMKLVELYDNRKERLKDLNPSPEFE